MNDELLTLAADLIAIPSVSYMSNRPVADAIADWLRDRGFTVEALTYKDENGVAKVSLIGQRGQGSGGLAFFGHSDTVPGQEHVWPAFQPQVRDGRLYGRGSCDMKGPIAAAMVAAAAADLARLNAPVFVVITADEETGGDGAQQVVAESRLLREAQTRYGVVIEPTRLIPVYAHKGICIVDVTATGTAAHTSTDLGDSATFRMVPFLSAMAALAAELRREPRFQNNQFSPPTNGFNMRIDDGQGAVNVTADRTVCRLGFRPMPNAGTEEILTRINAAAAAHDLTVSTRLLEPYSNTPEDPLVRAAAAITGRAPETVAFGTDALHLQRAFRLVILGPGDIVEAHTVGESVAVAELHAAAALYRKMIARFCLDDDAF